MKWLNWCALYRKNTIHCTSESVQKIVERLESDPQSRNQLIFKIGSIISRSISSLFWFVFCFFIFLFTTVHQPKTNLYLTGHQLIMRRWWLWMRRLLTCWVCWRWWSQRRILWNTHICNEKKNGKMYKHDKEHTNSQTNETNRTP